jgi:hypothetical protein
LLEAGQKIFAGINDFGVCQFYLVAMARTLNHFSEIVNKLVSKVQRENIKEFRKACKHLSSHINEIMGSAEHLTADDLLSEVILHGEKVAFAKQL